MTRINVVPVAELCDKHLLAEYRELPRVFKLATPYRKLPERYTLGKGHVIFFYNKLGYLATRFVEIVNEAKKRGFKVKYTTADVRGLNPVLFGDYTPTPEALALNRARIAERILQFRRP
jgi:deoxyribonuclease (pyrimidine dimer)